MAAEPRVGCGAAIIRDGRILLIRRLRDPQAGCWGLPGGKVDWLEPVEQAVRREIDEELGIELHELQLLCVVDQIDPANHQHWIAPVYLVRSFRGEPTLREPDKHDGLEWFALERLPASLTVETRVAVARFNRKAWSDR